jgi:uncharacterized membrane protein
MTVTHKGTTMNTAEIALFISVFLACAVEAVEAVTVVLAAGTARSWGSAGRGTIAAILVLTAVIAVFGPTISVLPMFVLRLVVGGLLLVFGLQWLRKAILRASGFKALHDEDAIFREELAAAKAAGKTSKFGVDDWYAFTVAFKAVLLEGLEVAFIVVTFGAIQNRVATAAWAALAAVVLVSILGFAARRPLSLVPENTLKFVVGIMLTSFGIFWAAQGAGAVWPGSDLAILALVGFVAAVSAVYVFALRARHTRFALIAAAVGEALTLEVDPSDIDEEVFIESKPNGFVAGLTSFGMFWYDFVVGDDWRVAFGVVAAMLVTALSAAGFTANWIILPIVVAGLVGMTVNSAAKKVLVK